MLYTFLFPGGGGAGYTPPDLTVAPPEIPGLSGFQFNTSNRAREENPCEMMHVRVSPPIIIPQAYMARGLMTQQKLGAGRGILPTIIVTGRV